MRIIKESEELKTLVKVGDIVRLEGFTDEPVIAVVTRGNEYGDCSGCVLDSEVPCSVNGRTNKGEPARMDRNEIPIFGKFKSLDKVLEDL